jgi:hypothetical protein
VRIILAGPDRPADETSALGVAEVENLRESGVELM